MRLLAAFLCVWWDQVEYLIRRRGCGRIRSALEEREGRIDLLAVPGHLRALARPMLFDTSAGEADRAGLHPAHDVRRIGMAAEVFEGSCTDLMPARKPKA